MSGRLKTGDTSEFLERADLDVWKVYNEYQKNHSTFTREQISLRHVVSVVLDDAKIQAFATLLWEDDIDWRDIVERIRNFSGFDIMTVNYASNTVLTFQTSVSSLKDSGIVYIISGNKIVGKHTLLR